MTHLVEAVGVSRRVGRFEELRGIELVAPSGQVVALLGPNGAGKTTLGRMLATLLARIPANSASPGSTCRTGPTGCGG